MPTAQEIFNTIKGVPSSVTQASPAQKISPTGATDIFNIIKQTKVEVPPKKESLTKYFKSEVLEKSLLGVQPKSAGVQPSKEEKLFAAKPLSVAQKIIEKIKEPFVKQDRERVGVILSVQNALNNKYYKELSNELAKVQKITIAPEIIKKNIDTISKKYGVPKEVITYEDVDKNLDAYTKALEIRNSPTNADILTVAFAVPIATGLMTQTVPTILTLVGWQAISEIESLVISKSKNKPYKVFQNRGMNELLPDEANQMTRDIVGIADFLVKAVALRAVYKSSPEIIERFTKDLVVKYKLPETIFIDGTKMRDIWQTGKLTTVEEKQFVKDLNLTSEQLKDAFKNGISIEVPTEKIVIFSDKSYWAKIKSFLKIKPTEPQKTIFTEGKTTIPTKLLLEGEKSAKEIVDIIRETKPTERALKPVLKEIAEVKPEVKLIPKRTLVSEEFKVGDIIDTKGGSNMISPVRIREITGNTIKFTDAKGTDFAGMQRADLRRMINEKAWQKVSASKTGIISPSLQPLAQEARKYKSAEEFLRKRPDYSIGIGAEKPIFDSTGKKIGRLILNENNKEIQIRDIIRDTEMGKGIPTQIVNDLKQYAVAKNKQLSLSSIVPGTEKYWKGLGFAEDKTGKYFYNQAIRGAKEVKPIPEKLEVKGITTRDLVESKTKEEAKINETTKELSEIREIAGVEGKGPQEVGRVKKAEEIEKKLDDIYQKNKAEEEKLKEVPPMGLSIKITSEGSIKKPITPDHANQLKTHFQEFKKRIGEIISPFYFHKNAPLELRNAIRTEIIGGLHKIYESRDRNRIILWGGTKESDILKSVELIKLRDQLARIKAGKGNPEITIEEAEKALDKSEREVTKEALDAAERYRLLSRKYTQDLVDRGKLDPDELFEDYMRHYVVDYTPEWVFNKGIPTRLRQPFRGYLKRAGRTTKEYRVDQDTTLGQFLEIEHDNMIEDFIVDQSIKYDIRPTMTKEQKGKIFGSKDITRLGKKIKVFNQTKPGRIYFVDGKRYRGFSPSMPFGRVLYPTDEGAMALGKYRKTYLIPEEIYNVFRSFSERGSAPVYHLNRAIGFWKSWAILSHFTSFNINNFVGDSWMAMMQSPNPAKLLKELPTAFSYLAAKNPIGHLLELDKFIKENDIIEGTYIKGELPKIRKSKNPLYYIMRKGQDFSQLRESIMRIADASYLLKEMKRGNGPKLINHFNYMDIKKLPEREALGKVARDILVDYGWVSKTFNRFVRGFAFPFATWYFKGSALVWKYSAKHWGKALLAFLTLPVLASLFNDRNEKTRKMEGELPDFVQNRTHFIIGKNPDGSIKVLSLQLPQDALIGTKIFSIAVNQANLVAIREKSIKEAATDTLEQWGIKEAKGIAYLMNFSIRFIQGLITKTDPYDNAPVYSMNPDLMTPQQKFFEQSLYFFKTSVPIVSAYIKDYTLGNPMDITVKNTMDKLFGLGALGVFDTYPEDKIYYEGEEVAWDDIQVARTIYGREQAILSNIEDDWVKGGKYPTDFITTEDYKKRLEEIRNMYAEYVPEFKEYPIEDIALALGERLTNRLGNTEDSARRWYKIQLERAKTNEEKRKLGEQYKKMRQENMIEAIGAYSKTSREIFLQYLKKAR